MSSSCHPGNSPSQDFNKGFSVNYQCFDTHLPVPLGFELEKDLDSSAYHLLSTEPVQLPEDMSRGIPKPEEIVYESQEVEDKSYCKSKAKRVMHFYNPFSDYAKSVPYSSNNFLYLWDTTTNQVRKYRVIFRDRKGVELRKILIYADDLGNYVFEMTEIDYDKDEASEEAEEDEEEQETEEDGSLVG